MAKRMTVVFDDELLYTKLKVEAARTGRHAKDIVALAVRDWLVDAEDARSRSELPELRSQWESEGGVDASEFF